MSIAAARFVPVNATEMPSNVQLRGFTFSTARPYQTAWNLALGYAHLARHLLESIRGMTCEKYKCLAGSKKMVKVGPNQWQPTQNEVADLAFEAQSQNGAEVITAVWESLNRANKTRRMIRFGPVEESNAHAAAYAVALQIANEVVAGEPITISVSDLDRLVALLNAVPNDIDLFAATISSEGYRGYSSIPHAIADDLQSNRIVEKCAIKIVGVTVLVKGKEIPLKMTANRAADALVFLAALIGENGNWISSSEINAQEKKKPNEGKAGIRWDRVCEELPVEIKEHIASAPGKGFCIRLA